MDWKRSMVWPWEVSGVLLRQQCGSDNFPWLLCTPGRPAQQFRLFPFPPHPGALQRALPGPYRILHRCCRCCPCPGIPVVGSVGAPGTHRLLNGASQTCKSRKSHVTQTASYPANTAADVPQLWVCYANSTLDMFFNHWAQKVKLISK